MLNLINPEIDRYLDRLSRVDDPVLREMESRAEQLDFPIVGPQVGRLLQLLARLRKPRRILELGSGFGYSAYWFAGALSDQAAVILTEHKADNLELARGFLERGSFACRFEFHEGDALETLDRLQGQFDIILIDVDKREYPAAFDKAIGRLLPGGMLITDNTLWSGRVLDARPDPDTAGVLEYTDRIFRHAGLFSLILPVRDGVAVSLKQ